MSTENNPNGRTYCPRDVTEHNSRLDAILRSRYHMTLAHWKTVKWATYLAAMVVIGMAIDHGVEPFWAVTAAAFILGGPEFLEYLAVQKYDVGQQTSDDED